MPTPIAKVETFTGKSGQEVEKWIDDVEVCSRLEQVRENDRFKFALQFLSDSVTNCVRSLTVPLEKISGRTWQWDWVRLKVTLKGIDKQIKKYQSERRTRRWLRVAALGALVGAAGPFALGLSAAATAACAFGGSFVALHTPSGQEIVASARAAAIVEETSGKYSSPSVAMQTISDIAVKSPSDTWEDAANFRPSVELVSELLEMLVPNKNMH